MAITFGCDCGKALRARDELAGKKTRCTGCGTILRIPGAAAEVPEPVPVLLFDDDEDDGSPYGVIEPEPRAPAARAPSVSATSATARPVDSGATSTYYPSPRSGGKPMRFRPTPAESAPATPPAATAKQPRARPRSASSLREYSYIFLAFALIPLMVSLLGQDSKLDLQERFARTIEQAPPADRARIEATLGQDSMTLEQALAALPGGKLVGAHLPRDTSVHWAYAAVATAGFLLLLALCFSVERAHPAHLLGVGAFTATAGILFLFAVQFCSMIRLGGIRGRGLGLIILLIMTFIGWSYESAHDPESSFLISALGFTFGVGLCEEFTKAIPMFFWFRRYSEVGWRGACLWGLASGIGFGIAEGIMYAGRYYNGISGGDIYLVRFVSCVALHAMWAGSVGIAIARNVDHYEGIDDAAGFGLFALKVMAVPMVLHGFYDTLLKKDMNAWALLVALLSFGWLAWQVELARKARAKAGRPQASRRAVASY